MYAMFMVLVSLVQPALAQDRCVMTFNVTCDDCVAGDVWAGEIADGFGNSFGVKDRMESGGQLVTSAPPGTTLILWVNGQQVTTVTCTAGSNTQTVRLTRQQVVKPVDEPDEDANTGGDTADPQADERPIPQGKAHNVGTGAPARGVQPLWLGNDGDYPTATNPARRGHFISGQRNCPAGKIPLIQGTAATIDGGIPGQIALDDARATACAPPDWDGEYVGSTGTTIIGRDAAGIYCVLPNSITRREPAAMAAVIPPPQGDLVVEKLSGPTNLAVGGEGNFTATVRNTGNAPVTASWLRFEMDGARLDEVAVPPLAAGESAEVISATWKSTSGGLHTPRAIADSRKEVPEANEWDNERDVWLDVAAPAKKTSGSSKPTPFLTRGGPWLGAQLVVGEAVYFHALVGGFVTLRLADRIWLEPYVGVGTDGWSTHPDGWDSANQTTTPNDGWFTSIAGGLRLPIVAHRWVNEEKGNTYFLVSPGVGWVGDDLTHPLTYWGSIVSLTGQAEFWWDRKIPLGLYLETGVSYEAWLNYHAEKDRSFGWPLMVGVKVPF